MKEKEAQLQVFVQESAKIQKEVDRVQKLLDSGKGDKKELQEIMRGLRGALVEMSQGAK